jgi:thiol-disulfide isomerase/thioredoxin
MKILVALLFLLTRPAFSQIFGEDIATDRLIPLSATKDKPLAFILVQTNCSYCKLQFEEMACIQKKTPLRFFAILTQGEPSEMRKEVANLKLPFPILKLSPERLKQWEMLTSTPQIWIWEGKDQFTKKSRGVLSCDKW